MTAYSKVPDESAWYGYETDLDAKWLHDLVFGKNLDEVQEYFGGGSSIERMSELLFCPRPVFQYYVQAFALFVMSDKCIDDPDSASSFLNLLSVREKKDPGSVREIYSLVSGCVDFIAPNQRRFDADEDIYGNFSEIAQKVREVCNA